MKTKRRVGHEYTWRELRPQPKNNAKDSQYTEDAEDTAGSGVEIICLRITSWYLPCNPRPPCTFFLSELSFSGSVRRFRFRVRTTMKNSASTTCNPKQELEMALFGAPNLRTMRKFNREYYGSDQETHSRPISYLCGSVSICGGPKLLASGGCRSNLLNVIDMVQTL